MVLGRKHSRSSDEEVSSRKSKKVKLENLLDGLSLSDQAKTQVLSESKHKSGANEFAINQKIKEHPVFKKPPLSPGSNTLNSPSHINSYIAEKLFAHFQGIKNTHMAVVPWYNDKFLIVYRFQMWIVRNFNRFLKKYNKHNGSKIKPIKYYDKIIHLLEQGRLTMHDLMSIVLQESTLELEEIKRNDARRKAAYESSKIEELSDIKYNYWDTIKLDNDLDLMEEELESYATNDAFPRGLSSHFMEEEMQETDVEMDIDDTPNSNESNYGSYYFDYSDSTGRIPRHA